MFSAIWFISKTNAEETLQNVNWPMYRHDLNHTGYSTSNAPNNNDTSWIYQTEHQIVSSPAIVASRLTGPRKFLRSLEIQALTFPIKFDILSL